MVYPETGRGPSDRVDTEDDRVEFVSGPCSPGVLDQGPITSYNRSMGYRGGVKVRRVRMVGL